MYAILDIETTGGKFNEEGITEIAIYKFDGHQVVDQFISLVNPERSIQPYVEKLTGINSKMLASAPKFYEVAKRIVEITENAIIVAHNAQFDYRILRTEFRRLGFTFKKDSICTVELSQRLLPDQKSHSLGKLVRALGIPMADRHRASGDALATVELFKLLLNKDVDKLIVSETIKNLDSQFNEKIHDLVRPLPTQTGVYYLHDTEGEIIFIGKSRNIKKRVNQHLTNTNSKSVQLQKETASITFELTGSEMIALLTEIREISALKPKYNFKSEKLNFTHALYPITNDHGYIELKILKADGRKKHITTFTNYNSAKNFMHKISEHYGLCQKYTGEHNEKGGCEKYKKQECAGACVFEEEAAVYNERVREVVAKYGFRDKSSLILGRGRQINEKSVVFIEDGDLQGFGFYKLNHQISSLERIKTIITPFSHTKNAQHIIQSQLRKSKLYKEIPLPE